MPKLVSDRTAAKIVRLLNKHDGGGDSRRGGGSARWALVRCTSDTAVGGNVVLDQCYPAIILQPSADYPAPPEITALCLLTLLGINGNPVTPRIGGVYYALITGEVESDRSGSGSSQVRGRSRAFAVTAGASGVSFSGSSGDGPESGVVGGASVAGIDTDSCLAVDVVRVSGRCSEIAYQHIQLVYDGEDDRWESLTDFVHDLGTGPVYFTLTYPVPEMSIDGMPGIYLGSEGGALYYSFASQLLCDAGDPAICQNYIVVAVTCTGCGEGGDPYSPGARAINTGTTTVTITVDSQSTAPTLLNFALDPTDCPFGVFAATLTAPDGTVYRLFTLPASALGTATATTINLVLGPGGPLGAIQSATTNAVGWFTPQDDFSAYTGNPNGDWVVTIFNGCEQPVTAYSSLCFGTPEPAAFTVAPGITPTSGTAPLEVEADPEFTGGTPYIVSIDWGDGSPVEWFDPADLPATHTYSTEDEFEAVVTGYTECGATADDSETITTGTFPGCAEAPDPLGYEVSSDVECLDGHTDTLTQIIPGTWSDDNTPSPCSTDDGFDLTCAGDVWTATYNGIALTLTGEGPTTLTFENTTADFPFEAPGDSVFTVSIP